MAAFDFLKLNGLTLKCSGREFEKVILDVAEGKLAKSGAAEFFRKHAREA
jgi:prophage maintenance system killer protein